MTWLIWLCIGISFIVFVFGIAMLIEARGDAWREEKTSLANLTMALERDISRTISVYDLSLQGGIEALQVPGIESVSPQIRQVALFDRAASAEYLGSVLVLDANGNVTADSTSVDPHHINLADRDYFQQARGRTDDGLYISVPYFSRMRDGDPSIALSRRISGPAGEFQGVIMGALRLAYFDRLFASYQLGSGSRIAVLRTDGRLLARAPANWDYLGQDFSDTKLFKAVGTSVSGYVTATAANDGITRLIAYRHLAGLPLIVTVGVSVDDIYAAWRKKAVNIGLVLTLLCGSTMLLCLLFRREMKRRRAAEVELMAAAAKLSIAAETDALTELGNRRHFEKSLHREWRSAIRNETQLSLLILDVDRFKLFNDRYGHQAGDEVLRMVAGCIDASLNRALDVAARYGGEEFVVILPDTDAGGAVIIAERIRLAIERLAIRHPSSEFGCTTVSIGVASVRPQLGQDSGMLLRRADAMLYEAKRLGRNQICSVMADELGDARPFLVAVA